MCVCVCVCTCVGVILIFSSDHRFRLKNKTKKHHHQNIYLVKLNYRAALFHTGQTIQGREPASCACARDAIDYFPYYVSAFCPPTVHRAEHSHLVRCGARHWALSTCTEHAYICHSLCQCSPSTMIASIRTVRGVLGKWQFYVICTAWCPWDFSCIYLWMTFYLDVYLLLL